MSHSAHMAQEIDHVFFQRARLAVELKQNTTDVWQWLTDVSATHFTDGYDEAEEHAKAFKEALAEIKKLYPANDQKLAGIETSFDSFYKTGKRMANAYINEGIEGGNKVMEEFDKVGEDIQERVTSLKGVSEKELEKNLDEISSDLSFAKFANLVALLIAIVIGLLAAALIARMIVVPIKGVVVMLKDIAEGEGDLTKRLEVSSQDEVGELAERSNETAGRISDLIKRSDLNVSEGKEIIGKTGQMLEDIINNVNIHISFMINNNIVIFHKLR